MIKVGFVTALLQLKIGDDAGSALALTPSWATYAAALDDAAPWPLRVQSDAQTLPVLLNRLLPAGPASHDMAARLAHDLAHSIQAVIKLQGGVAADVTCGDARHAELYYADNSAFLFCLDPVGGTWQQAAEPHGLLWAAVNVMDSEAWDAAEPPVEEFEAGEIQRLRQWQQNFHRMIALAQQDADLSLDAQGMLVGLLASSSAVMAGLQQYTRPADSTRRRRLAGRILDDVRGLYHKAMNVTSRADAPPMLRVQLHNSMRHLPQTALRYRVTDLSGRLAHLPRITVQQAFARQQTAARIMAAGMGVRAVQQSFTPAALRHGRARIRIAPMARQRILRRIPARPVIAVQRAGQVRLGTRRTVVALRQAARPVLPVTAQQTRQRAALKTAAVAAVSVVAARRPHVAVARAIKEKVAVTARQAAAQQNFAYVAPTVTKAAPTVTPTPKGESRTVVAITPQALAAGGTSFKAPAAGGSAKTGAAAPTEKKADVKKTEVIKFRRPRRRKRKIAGPAAGHITAHITSVPDAPRQGRMAELPKIAAVNIEPQPATIAHVAKTTIKVVAPGALQAEPAQVLQAAATVTSQSFSATAEHICGPNCEIHNPKALTGDATREADLLGALLGGQPTAAEKKTVPTEAAFAAAAEHICGPNCEIHNPKALTGDATREADLLGALLGTGDVPPPKEADLMATLLGDSAPVGMEWCAATGTWGKCNCGDKVLADDLKPVDAAAKTPDISPDVAKRLAKNLKLEEYANV